MFNEGATPGEGAPVAKPRKAKAKPKAKKAKGKAKGNGVSRPRTGVGETCKKLIAQHPNWSNQQIADAAKKRHPDSSTNAQCVAWYKSQSGSKKPKAKKKG